MLKKCLILFYFLSFIFLACEEEKPSVKFMADSSLQTQGSLELIPIAENIISPVAFAHTDDDRFFIVQQPGVIRIIKNGKVLEPPFLDISSKVEEGSGYSEKGLLGMAFHPQYNTNGRFFLYYSVPSQLRGADHKTILAEYNVSSVNPDLASPDPIVLLEIQQPESNHNGGQIAFGPDGYLYISTGDGGGAGDKHGNIGNSQNLENLLGKILRIDVDSKKPYAVPESNPFIKDLRARPEIWAYGLRNPWRFSFDRKTGTLYCGDVGQNSYEEIDIIEKGNNYGWRAMEGNMVYDEKIKKEGMVPPIYTYPRDVGICVIGGYVYRGKEISSLNGKYVFADWNGKLFYLEQNAQEWVRKPIPYVRETGFTINTLGEDNQGELYVIGQNEVGANSNTGIIYKLSQAQAD